VIYVEPAGEKTGICLGATAAGPQGAALPAPCWRAGRGESGCARRDRAGSTSARPLLKAAAAGPNGVPTQLDHCEGFSRRYAVPLHVLLRACLSRAATLEWGRNWPTAVVRWLMCLVLSLTAGSIFWQLPVSFPGAVSALGLIFWVLCFTLVCTVPTAELTFQRRPILLRQRRDRFYPGWADAVPQASVGRQGGSKGGQREGRGQRTQKEWGRSLCGARPGSQLADLRPAVAGQPPPSSCRCGPCDR
jgi:hypothetical protein